MTNIAINEATIRAAFGRPVPACAITLTHRTIRDFVADRNFYGRLGYLSHDDGKKLRVERAQINCRDPLVDVTVVDFGSIRGVLIEPAGTASDVRHMSRTAR